MAVQQTDCYKVVTIGYLKSFIGTNIQNSSGNVVYVNAGGKPDSYCPTYSELTGGTYIQTWSAGSSPKGDRDGITVSSVATLGGNYSSNQLVNQKDLGLKYTRFNTLTISRPNSNTLSECGGSASMSYTYNYKRYTKTMGDSCSTATTNTTVNGSCSEISYSSSNFGSVSNCTTFSFGKNGSVSSSSRSTTVTGSVTFRGTSHSDTVSFTQAALTGGYTGGPSSTRTVTTSVSASRSTSETFGCDGGNYGATGTKYYDSYATYYWVDSCGESYTSLTAETKTGTGSTPLDSQTGSFGSVECDCEDDFSRTARLTFSDGGYSDYVTFTQSCLACPDDDKCKLPVVTCPDSGDSVGSWDGVVFRGSAYLAGGETTEQDIIAFKTGDTTFTELPTLSCDGTIVTSVNWSYGAETPPGWTRIAVTHSANPSTTTERTGGTVTITAPTSGSNNCVYTISFTQNKYTQPPSCTCPGKAILLVIPASCFTGSYDYFVILDRIINVQEYSSCFTVIENNADRIASASTPAEVALGHYIYDECVIRSASVRNKTYFRLSVSGGDCSGSNENMVAYTGTYVLYGHKDLGEGVRSLTPIKTIVMPTSTQCQEGAQDKGGACVYYF